jgi:hypothetical protein
MSHKLKANSPDQGSSVALFDLGFEVDLVNATAAIKEGVLMITKGTAIALTLAPPVAGLPNASGDDGKVLRIVSTTAAAHVVTCSDGFNAKGSSGTATFGAAIGNAATLVAYNGHWYNVAQAGITYA